MDGADCAHLYRRGGSGDEALAGWRSSAGRLLLCRMFNLTFGTQL